MGQHAQSLTSHVTTRRGIDLGHQEAQRLIEELETLYAMSRSEWLAADPVASLLCAQLGYEDTAELEDALNGEFADFLAMLPTVDLDRRVPHPGAPVELYFRIHPEPPREQWTCTRLEYKVEEPKQLWNVLLKSPYARVEIEALGLEICADGRKRTDTVWNYLSGAALDLGMHVQSNRGMSDDATDKTVAVIEGLAALRDVDEQWTMIVVDPSGMSRFTDMERVTVIENYVDIGSHVDRDDEAEAEKAAEESSAPEGDAREDDEKVDDAAPASPSSRAAAASPADEPSESHDAKE
ncbi:hypothetical protein GGF31_001679 [Allomyces arbusculus]|nr:hypothetical protein GGF31_001679 [Allomyces arbusculus]